MVFDQSGQNFLTGTIDEIDNRTVEILSIRRIVSLAIRRQAFRRSLFQVDSIRTGQQAFGERVLLDHAGVKAWHIVGTNTRLVGGGYRTPEH